MTKVLEEWASGRGTLSVVQQLQIKHIIYINIDSSVYSKYKIIQRNYSFPETEEQWKTLALFQAVIVLFTVMKSLSEKLTGIEKENRESDSRSNELMRKHWRPMQQSENKLGGTKADCRKYCCTIENATISNLGFSVNMLVIYLVSKKSTLHYVFWSWYVTFL